MDTLGMTLDVLGASVVEVDFKEDFEEVPRLRLRTTDSTPLPRGR